MLKYMTKYFDFDAQSVVALQKAADADDGQDVYEIKARFTDETPDSHGDIITRTGTTNALPDYREWRNIRYMHQPKAVGLAKHIGENDGAELEWNEVIVKLVDKDTIHQVREGVLKGLSVGILFNPFDNKSCELTDDGGWVIKEYMLAEISVVDHPAHPNASVIEASLGEVQNEKISTITQELKDAIRSATSTADLVPLLKSLSSKKKEEDMPTLEEKEIVEEVVEEVEVVEEEEEVKVEAEAEVVVEAEVEVEAEVVEEVELVEEAEEVVAEVEAEVAPEVEPDVVKEVEVEVVPEPVVEVEPIVEEEVVAEVVEEVEVIEVEEELEEVEEDELPSESNEEEEKSIKVSEDTLLIRLERIEALLAKAFGEDAEVVEAVEVEAETETLDVDELEVKVIEEEELSTPSNRKSNIELGVVAEEDESELSELDKKFTFSAKRTDSQTRIRKTLENFKL